MKIRPTSRMTHSKPTHLFLILLACVGTLEAGEPKKCTADQKECESQIRHMLEGRKYLGVELANAYQGITVRSVMPESPAQIARLRVGDILMSIDGHDVTSMQVREIKPFIERAKSRNRIMMIVRRANTLDRADMRFAVMQKKQIDKIIAAHMRGSHTVSGTD